MGATLSNLPNDIMTYFTSSESIIYDLERETKSGMRKLEQKILLLERELEMKTGDFEDACSVYPKKPVSIEEFRFLYTIPILRIKTRLKHYNKQLTKLSIALAEISAAGTELSLIGTTDKLNTILGRKYPNTKAVFNYQLKIEKARATRDIVQDVLNETYNDDEIENEISNDEANLLESSNFFPPEMIRPHLKVQNKQNENDVPDNISLPTAPIGNIL